MMMNEKVIMEPMTGSGAFFTNDKTLTFVTKEAMLARLKTVARIAEDALANQPQELDQCWEHLRLALDKIDTE